MPAIGVTTKVLLSDGTVVVHKNCYPTYEADGRVIIDDYQDIVATYDLGEWDEVKIINEYAESNR